MPFRLLFSLFLTVGLLAASACAVAVEEDTPPEATMKEVVVTAPDERSSYASSSTTVAGKVPLKQREIPNSTSVLTRQQMDDQNMVTTWDALSQMTGVQAISNDSVQGQYRIRGSSPDLRYDGAPTLYSLGGWQQFDLAMYDRIEVQRGPAGLLQGAGSYGGVVNLVRKRGQRDFSASVLGTYGTWNTKRIEADITGPLNESKTVRGRFVASMVDKEWFVSRYYDEKWLGYAALDVDIGANTTATFSVAHQEDESPGYSGLPTYTNGVNMNLDRSFNPCPVGCRMQWRTTEYAAGLEHRFDAQWVGKLQLTRREASLFFHDAFLRTGIDPATNTGTYRQREWDYKYQADDIDAYMNGPFELFGRKHNLLLGANYSWYESYGKGRNLADVTLVPFGDPPNLPDFTTIYNSGSQSVSWQQGVYGQARISILDPLTFVVGGRSSDYYSKSRNFSPSPETGWQPGTVKKHQLTPYGGLVYDVTSKVSIYGSYSEVFVPQSNRQADGTLLEPVIGSQYELGTKCEYFGGKLNVNFALFDIEEQNKSYADPNNPGFYLPLGETETKGWEAEVVGKLSAAWDVSAGYTNLITRVTKSSTPLAQEQPISYWYPRHQVKVWSNYRFPNGTLEGFSLGVGMQAQSRTASGTSTTTVAAREQSSFAVFAAQLGYKISKHYSTALVVNNLFDRTYYTRVQGTNTYMTYGEPRNVTLTLRATY